MLQAHQELRDKINPPPPPALIHTPVQFLPRIPEAVDPPPVDKQNIGAKYWWGDMFNILLWL